MSKLLNFMVPNGRSKISLNMIDYIIDFLNFIHLTWIYPQDDITCLGSGIPIKASFATGILGGG